MTENDTSSTISTVSKNLYSQFFTTKLNINQFLQNDRLKKLFDENVIVEPFFGNGDLYKQIQTFYDYDEQKVNEGLFYDIEIQNGQTFSDKVIQRDTLTNPPNYKNKVVLTNPPYRYISQMKGEQYTDIKQLLKTNGVDDTYKLFIQQLIEGDARGGLLIIPQNFFCEKRHELRRAFLLKYKVLQTAFYNYQTFEDTTQDVCVFSFERHQNPNAIQSQKLNVCIKTDEKTEKNILFVFSEENNFTIGGEYKLYVERLQNREDIEIVRIQQKHLNSENGFQNDFNTVLKLKALHDIKLEASDEIYYGKETDRMVASIQVYHKQKPITKQLQMRLIEEFNKTIQFLYMRYDGLCFTSYRDNGRKRIDFRQAYDYITILIEMILRQIIFVEKEPFDKFVQKQIQEMFVHNSKTIMNDIREIKNETTCEDSKRIKDLEQKIINHYERFKTILNIHHVTDYEQFLNFLIQNELYSISHFCKDPKKQNVFEKAQIAYNNKKLENAFLIQRIFVPKILIQQKENIFIINQREKDEYEYEMETKSFDGMIERETSILYFYMKHTTEEGGAQDNQFNDLKQFIQMASKFENDQEGIDKQVSFVALYDGKYYNQKKLQELNGINHKQRVQIKNSNDCIIW